MKLLTLSLILLSGVAAHADDGARPQFCPAGFKQMESRTSAIYTCAGAALACRKDWFVGGADAGVSRFSSYLCKADMTRMNSMVGETPASCSDGFHPRPAGVRNGESYECAATKAIIVPQCPMGYVAGTLTLAGRPLGYAGGAAAATRRQLDGASISYLCTKQ